MLRLTAGTLMAMAMSTSVALAAPKDMVGNGPQPMHFDSEARAQENCPNDVIVWLNTNSGIYHHLSVTRYGRTHRGGYVCKAEADAAGDREAQGKDR